MGRSDCVQAILSKTPALQELRLEAFDFDEYPRDMLSSLIELRTLVIARAIPTKEFLRSIFLPRPDTNQTLPNLRKFIIEKPDLGFSISKTLIQIIESRVDSEDPAKRMEFHVWSEVRKSRSLQPNH
ncbi:hypothetical protein M422DRAFT_38336, partial [Sphaerobolus stellatus SS14]